MYNFIIKNLENVIFTTEDKLVAWMKNPKPYKDTIKMPEFACTPNLPESLACVNGAIT